MSEQVHLSMFEEVYPPELLQACAQQSPTRQQKRRRLRQFTALSVLWFLLALVLWSRLSQGRGSGKMTAWVANTLAEAAPKAPGGLALKLQRGMRGRGP